MEDAKLKKLISEVDSSELGEDDLYDVKSEVLNVAPRSRFFGEALHLSPSTVNLIEKSTGDPEQRLSSILMEFLKKNYDSNERGARVPSWKLIVAAVGCAAGGNDKGLAETIAKKYPASKGSHLEEQTLQTQLLDPQNTPPTVSDCGHQPLDGEGEKSAGALSTSHEISVQIEMEGELHALDKIPSENSAVVKIETETLLGVIDLKALVTDLDRVGGFIRVAYNAVGAAGYKFTKQQIEIQKLGYDITKLCDKSALTVAHFERASIDILGDLQNAFEYLLNNREKSALRTLAGISKVAKDMEKAALKLHEEFEEEEKKVIKVLESTQLAKQDQASQIEAEKKRQIELEKKVNEEQHLMEEYQQKERAAEATRQKIEQQEDRAIAGIGRSNFLVSFVSAIFGIQSGSEKEASALRQKRLEALEVEGAIREKRHAALSNMMSFTAQLTQCKSEQEIAKCAVEALHEAIGALKHLSAVMMQASFFWKQVEAHCHSLADSKVKEAVKDLQEEDKEERLKEYTSPSFKRNAIRYYSRWVALKKVCTTYMKQIKETQKDLYKYITENPTQEESKRALPELAAKFLDDLKRDQKALEEKDHKTQEEILALGPPEGKALEEKDRQ